MTESQRIRPGVAMPHRGVPLAAIWALGMVLGLALFLHLEGRRVTPGGAAAMLAPMPGAQDIPPLILPARIGSYAVSGAPVHATVMARPLARYALTAPTPYHDAPYHSGPYAQPTGLVGEEPLMAPRPAKPRTENPADSSGSGLTLDLTQGGGVPIARGSGEAAPAEDVARAAPMRGRATMIAQGTMLEAVLETPLNSDRPGLARAMVSGDVYGFDGTRILIPRGSRLIGEFKADAMAGQRRILAQWTRLIRPDGVTIRIGSPATDGLGGAGIPGVVNTHFAERFAGAVLQSALAVGVNVASALPVRGGNGAVYLALPGQQMAQAGGALNGSGARASTIKVAEGTRIAVLVARDLDFSGTPAWH